MEKIEPWDAKIEDNREPDTVTNFILFCEGKNTEPLYFSPFQNEKVKINPTGKWLAGYKHIDNALHKCKEQGLTETRQGAEMIREDISGQVWCVYDRDQKEENPEMISAADDMIFTNSIRSGQTAGMNIAWSNDVFEVWMLLHFENIPTGVRLHRHEIYNRLTIVFRALPNQSPELLAKTSDPNFNFEHFSKRRENFINLVRPILLSRTQEAIERAALLEAHYGTDIAYHDRNPGTCVHKLVLAILAASV